MDELITIFKAKRLMYFIIVVLIVVFIIIENNNLDTTTIQYRSDKLPDSFDNFTIVQISDLHNKRFKKDQSKILNEINKQSPDIIVVTGDLIDRRRYNLDVATKFIEGAVKIAPVYYVSGNHEAWSQKYHEIKKMLLKHNVIVLDDKKDNIEIGGEAIEIIGLTDPAFDTATGSNKMNLTRFEKDLVRLSKSNYFKILLSHRPELVDLYEHNNIDLTFSGHAHGGQFRLPFVGGVFAPNQGFFPKYTSGKHQIGDSTLIISRGLGNSVIPLRIFNRPEIVKVVFSVKE